MTFLFQNPFKDSDVVNELKIDLQKANFNEAESAVMVKKLCGWLCRTPPNIIFRVNTLVSEREEIYSLIKKALLELNSELPEMLTIPEIPELIIIKAWEETTKKALKTDSAEVIVDAACGSAVLRGAHIYAPGIMGIPFGLKIGDTVSVFADVANNCKKGLYKRYESDKKLFIGNGIVNMTRESIFGNGASPRGIAVYMNSVTSKVPQLNEEAVPKGFAVLQNLPSIICSRILNPGPGETVLDMCAAPGNKTTHIGALMNNQGTLIALEKNKRKIDKLRTNCANFGLKNTSIFCTDSTGAACDVENKSVLTGPPFSEKTFDRVLLDGPCSALGQRPQLANGISVSELRSYVPLQRKLFSAAARLLKPGGTLVYSTCTVTVAENEGIVVWALKTFPNLHLASIPQKIKRLNLENYCSSGFIIEGLTPEQSQNLCRFGPGSDTVGFFIACFVKSD